MNKNQTSLEILEHNKRSNILFFEGKSVWEGYLGRREDFLTSDYWKNWREKIKNFQNQDEMDFYVNRLSALMGFIYQSVADKGWVDNEIKKEEERLENISEKEWKKEDKFADVELKEVSAEEILNDPWFNEKIDKIFGLENGKLSKEKPVEKDSDNDVDYKSWAKDQLIAEINRLKAENEQLKNNQTLTSTEKENKLQKNQQKLEKVEYYMGANSELNNSNNKSQKNNNSIGTGGIIVIVAIGSLLIVGIIMAKKRLNKKLKK